jgi:hypothetical protein
VTTESNPSPRLPRRRKPTRAEYFRKRVLEDWRGISSGEPPERLVSLADALAACLADLGLADQVSEEEMREAWEELVGDFLSAHSQPAGLKRGTLTIQVLQPMVRYELERSWKPKILSNLQARFGKDKVRTIRFQ